MSKIISAIIFFIVILFQFPSAVKAQTVTISNIPDLLVGEQGTVTVSGLEPDMDYYWLETRNVIEYYHDCINSGPSGEVTRQLGPYGVPGTYQLQITLSDANQCSPFTANFSKSNQFNVYNLPGGPTCILSTKPDPILNVTFPSAKFIVNVGNTGLFYAWKMQFECGVQNVGPATVENSTEISRTMPNSIDATQCEFFTGNHTIKVIGFTGTEDVNFCTTSYTVIDSSVNGTCTWDVGPPLQVKDNKCTNGTVPTKWGNALTPECKCVLPGSGGGMPLPPPSISPASAGGKSCGTVDPDHPSFQTAIGCIPTNPSEFAQAVLKFVLGIGGGLAFLLMLLGAFQMLTSAGNPETLHAGKERFTDAIIGLLFIIFSILLLQIIGVDILGLRELGK